MGTDRRQAEKRLRILEAATSLGDLSALNSNWLEALKGNRKGQYSIRITDPRRICFEWLKDQPGPSNFEIVDDHFEHLIEEISKARGMPVDKYPECKQAFNNVHKSIVAVWSRIEQFESVFAKHCLKLPEANQNEIDGNIRLLKRTASQLKRHTSADYFKLPKFPYIHPALRECALWYGPSL